METLAKQSGTYHPRTKKTHQKVVQVLRYLTLILLMFVAASHESANPKIGETNFDFFANDTKKAIENKLNKISTDKIDSVLHTTLINIYSNNNYLPLWSINFNTNQNFTQLITLLQNAHYYGLNSKNYQLPQIDSLTNVLNQTNEDKLNVYNRVEFELQTTKSFIRFCSHLRLGLNSIDTSKTSTDFRESLYSYFEPYFKSDTIESGILALQPQLVQYQYLQIALKQYLDKVTLSSTKANISIKATNEELRTYFAKYWDLNDSLTNDSNFVENSIIEFQKMHGLKADGKLNRRTVSAMNVPTSYRFYQAAMNLDRLRKSSIETNKCILVNIPEFKLHIFKNNEIVKQHIVVVGTPRTPTPELESSIQKVVANPYWTVPKSIAVNEIIPRIKQDSTYMKRNGYEVVDNRLNPVDATSIDWNTITSSEFKYWFRQNKGRGNALGVVKFLFPNDYSVYLHDTPSKSKFKYDIRAYSHGCVRVQNPEDLAEYVINEYYKEKTNIKSVIKKREHKEFELDEELPVYLKYYTCSADSKGNIVFHTDIYKKDKEEIKTLFPEYLPV